MQSASGKALNFIQTGQLQDLVESASRFTFETPSHKLQLLKSHLLNLRRTAGVPVSTERAGATTGFCGVPLYGRHSQSRICGVPQ